MLLRRSRVAAVALSAATLALVACGGGADGGGASSPNARPAPPSSPELAAAAAPKAAEFPAVAGRTLRQLADTLEPGPEAGLATTVYVPGRNRVAFGLIDADNRFVYGRTAVYVARSPNARARGPFVAPADSLEVRTAFRSQTSNSTPGELKAIYRAQVDLPRPGRWFLLTVTKVGDTLYGATADVHVSDDDGIPAVGERPPRVDTPTLASVGGQVERIDTRTPPTDMHDVNFADVLGRRPIALLFATPALCQSRVCGPVADIAQQLKAAYGDRVAFIHNEVYVDNVPARGVRPQLRAFGLPTEPWLFTVDADGRVAARLEGSFGVAEFRAAVEAALAGASTSDAAGRGAGA